MPEENEEEEKKILDSDELKPKEYPGNKNLENYPFVFEGFDKGKLEKAIEIYKAYPKNVCDELYETYKKSLNIRVPTLKFGFKPKVTIPNAKSSKKPEIDGMEIVITQSDEPNALFTNMIIAEAKRWGCIWAKNL